MSSDNNRVRMFTLDRGSQAHGSFEQLLVQNGTLRRTNTQTHTQTNNTLDRVAEDWNGDNDNNTRDWLESMSRGDMTVISLDRNSVDTFERFLRSGADGLQEKTKRGTFERLVDQGAVSFGNDVGERRMDEDDDY
ncbi:hypothetical protein HDU76_011654 [Blyttiomyces sp. JEL0837]|nr:hypothetical protein HDU76_011654 [Blyttiomyces sp. JEL0837]